MGLGAVGQGFAIDDGIKCDVLSLDTTLFTFVLNSVELLKTIGFVGLKEGLVGFVDLGKGVEVVVVVIVGGLVLVVVVRVED